MPKKVKKIWISLQPDLSDLAVGICRDNDYAEVIALIRQIDIEQQDWEFTRMLKALVDELMEEDLDRKVGSKTEESRREEEMG